MYTVPDGRAESDWVRLSMPSVRIDTPVNRVI